MSKIRAEIYVVGREMHANGRPCLNSRRRVATSQLVETVGDTCGQRSQET